jgi:hypothetical protein
MVLCCKLLEAKAQLKQGPRNENPHVLLFCLRMRSNELNRRFDGVNLVCLVVRDLEPKFFLKRHHNLHNVQAIQP